MDSLGFEYSCNMDMGTSAVHINGKRLYKGLCRALLVSGTECAVSDTVHSIRKEDKGRNAGGDYLIRLYV